MLRRIHSFWGRGAWLTICSAVIQVGGDVIGNGQITINEWIQSPRSKQSAPTSNRNRKKGRCINKAWICFWRCRTSLWLLRVKNWDYKEYRGDHQSNTSTSTLPENEGLKASKKTELVMLFQHTCWRKLRLENGMSLFRRWTLYSSSCR